MSAIIVSVIVGCAALAVALVPVVVLLLRNSAAQRHGLVECNGLVADEPARVFAQSGHRELAGGG